MSESESAMDAAREKFRATHDVTRTGREYRARCEAWKRERGIR